MSQRRGGFSAHCKAGAVWMVLGSGRRVAISMDAAGFDAWGRGTSYTDATGNVATTSYDPAGFVAATSDGRTDTSWSYDSGTDRRGFPTGVDYHLPGLPSTSTASFDAGGDPTVSLLNRVVNASVSDAAGNLTSDTYTTAAASGRGLGGLRSYGDIGRWRVVGVMG